jgi:5-methylcytosine-specific restriction protein A
MPNLPRLFRPKHLGPRKHAEARRQQDLAQRRGYRELKTARWRRFRKLVIAPLCVCCKANGRPTAAALVDHIIPHHGDEALIYDEGNCQSLCNWCHEHIKKSLEHLYEQGKVGAAELRLDRHIAEHYNHVPA